MAAKKKVAKKTKPKKKTKALAKGYYEARNKNDNEKGSVTQNLEKTYGKTFSESEVIAILDEDLKDAWEKLRAFAAGLGKQRIYASTQSIMFATKVCYFYARPKKKYIEVWFFLSRKIDGLKSTQGSSVKEKHMNLFKLTHADQVEEPLTDWISEAFDFASFTP